MGRLGRWALVGVMGAVALLLLLAAPRGGAQTPAPQTAATAPVERRDASVDAAAQWIGRALFLRCFCSENVLSFDAQGRALGQVKAEDWTLAGVNLTQVERKGSNVVELDGVRVAVRWATDRHEFDRHPQKEDKVRITVADPGDGLGMERALRAVFAVGIDRPLQMAMPEYWQHYFDPGMAWPADALTGQVVYPGPGLAKEVPAEATHKAEAGYSALASRDRVTGTVKLRMVVDAEGVPRRVSVTQPLGYGLDALAVEAVRKWRFKPATVDGKPVAEAVQVGQDFVVVQVP